MRALQQTGQGKEMTSESGKEVWWEGAFLQGVAVKGKCCSKNNISTMEIEVAVHRWCGNVVLSAWVRSLLSKWKSAVGPPQNYTVVCRQWCEKKRKSPASTTVPSLLGSPVLKNYVFHFQGKKLLFVVSLNSTQRTSFHALETYNMRGRSHGGHTRGNCMTGLKAGEGALLWISVEGLLEHGANHQRIHGVERSHGLWRLLQGPQSCNGLVTWKTLRAKD